MKRTKAAVIAVGTTAGAMLVATIATAVADNNDVTASCTARPVVSDTGGSQQITVVCNVPKPAQATVTTTVAAPGPTVTVTATPSAGPTQATSSTATSDPTSSATATGTPTGTAVPTQTASPTGGPGGTGLRGWQLTSRNIGLAPFGLSCDSLPRYTGSLTPARGTVISEKLITGSLDLRNGGITVERSCIRPSSGNNVALVSNYVCGADDCPVISDETVVIRDSEIDAEALPASAIAGACAFRGTGILQRNYMHGMGSGICFYGTGMKHDAIAEQNYVTGLRSAGSSHNEAATLRDLMRDQNPNRVARFLNNRLDSESGNDTGGLFIQPTWDDIDNLTVEGNLLEGGGYNLYLNKSHGSYRDVHAVNNRFRSTGWGPSAVDPGPAWDEWSANYRYDPSRPDAKGAVVNP